MMQRQTTGGLSRQQEISKAINNLIVSYEAMAKLAQSETDDQTRYSMCMDMYDILKELQQYIAHFNLDQ